MTTLALSRSFSPITVGLGRAASSTEAIQLWKFVGHAVEDVKQVRSDRAFVFNELFAFADQSERVAAGEALVGWATLALAKRFLTALPMDLAAPELGVDPDGEISFDWFGNEGRNFSVSLRHDGRVAYGGAFGPESTRYGTDLFDDQIPQSIVEAVRDLRPTG